MIQKLKPVRKGKSRQPVAKKQVCHQRMECTCDACSLDWEMAHMGRWVRLPVGL